MFVTEKMDHISGLPKIILHNILSKLPTKHAARTSVLSKEWRETWLTFPILDFCDTLVMGGPPYDEQVLCKKDIFVDYVKKTLQRFCDRGLAIKKFKLTLNCLDFEDLSHQHLDLWLKLACESGVKIVEVYLSDVDDIGQWYRFPPSVLESKSLKKLVLMGGIKIDLEFLNHSNRFFSLQELSWWSVLLQDEREFERFISQCPLIEHITLKCCYVYKPPTIWDQQVSWTSPLNSIRMRGLQNLKVFDVQGLQEVYIDAPNLESLCFVPNSRDVPYKLDFDSCRNLRLLHLYSWNSTVLSDKWFIELFSKFPFLESLKFQNCSISESINISNAQLKVLVFSNCCNLKEVNIDAPNLISCGFFGSPCRRVVSFLSCSSQLEVNVALSINYKDLLDLREFIKDLKPRNVLASLSLFVFNQYTDEPKPYVLQPLSPLPHIKHLDLRTVPEDEAFFFPLLNCLFSICCPETISLFLRRQFCTKPFAEFLYETLMGRKQGECHCSSGNECWWHGVKNVKVTCELNLDENLDFKTMLDALPAAGENLFFSLEL